MKVSLTLIFLFVIFFPALAQEKVTRSIKDFGAKGNGYTDDHDAFLKAAKFFRNRKGSGTLLIPKGVYIVGRQNFTGKGNENKRIAYTGEYVLDLSGCDNMIIEGNPGAVLKHRDKLRIGTFSPVTGKPFKHAIKEIQAKAEYERYASNAGILVYLKGSSNVIISGLTLDGNVGKFNLGGNWGNGRNAYELIHYGIYVLDSHDVNISDCIIKNFSCDGIYLANDGQKRKTFKITIDKCQVNYCGRNGLSWLGGESIRVTNSDFSNSGQGAVQASPSAGIDIEVENNSFCRDGYFYNCKMENNLGSAIASGSKELASGILFSKCVAASPVYYTVFVDAASHVFEDCKFYGTVLVWHQGKSEKDGTTFRRCQFEDIYRDKKMYDGGYQLGAEAKAVQVDSCTFRAYHTTSYYLAAHTKDCSPSNPEKIKVSNSSFYNYAKEGLKISPGIAGMAGFTAFYNNRFYALKGTRFQNGFEQNCNADAGKNQFYEAIKK